MTFLIRSELTDSDGNVIHDETVLAALASLETIERRFHTPDGDIIYKLTFDPPLRPPAPEED